MAVTAIVAGQQPPVVFEHLVSPDRFLDCQILLGKILIWQMRQTLLSFCLYFNYKSVLCSIIPTNPPQTGHCSNFEAKILGFIRPEKL